MSVGKFLKRHFQDQEVEFFTGSEAEWLLKAESNAINHMVVHAIFVDYDEECGVLTFAPIYDQNLRFYVAEDCIVKFWRPGLKFMKSVKTTVSGNKLYDKKNKDFM